MSNLIRPNGQPMMSPQQAAELYAVQQFQASYLSLVQVFTSDALRRHAQEEWKPEERIDTDWICDNAKTVATEAMKRLGINIV